MALKLSTGLRNHLMAVGSFKSAFQGGKLLIYSGAQPTDADAAATGTLLVTITNASGAYTTEVAATGTVTLNTGAAGSVDTLTVDSIAILPAAVPYNTSLSQTASDVATAINNYSTVPNYTATAVGAVITIKAAPGAGAGANGLVVASTVTTITKTDVNMGSAQSGISNINGLRFGISTSGSLVKYGTWSGVAVAGGVAAGWFRLLGATGEDGTPLRLDGNISTSGANLNMSSTIITASTTTTIDTFTVTEPAA